MMLRVKILIMVMAFFAGAASHAQSLVEIEVTPVSCSGEQDGRIDIHLLVQGDFHYKITGERYGSSPSFTGLEAGQYDVWIEEKDMHCEIHAGTVTVEESGELTVDVGNEEREVNYEECEDPPPVTLSAHASGGAGGYEFNWPDGTLEVTSGGDYTAVVTDSAGCTAEATVKVIFTPEDCSRDPNDILGPKGVGEEKWVSKYARLPYTIRFENDPVLAKAPAQVVKVTHPLSAQVDIFSFRLGSFGFGGFIFTVPEDQTFYQTRLDVADSLGVLVDITAGIDITKREAFWILESIDPLTGLGLTDASLGFLPVNDTLTRKGEGFVSYTIQAGTKTKTGDVIEAVADIVFDVNEPIITPKVFNTIDALPPSSTLEEVGERMFLGASIPLSVSAADDTGGSGVASYSLYVSENDSAYVLLAEDLPEGTHQVFTPTRAGSYCFYALAKDRAGNRETVKKKAEACITVERKAGLTLLSPSGGTALCENTELRIMWESKDIAAVDIFYTANGTDFFPIAERRNASDSLFIWYLPDSLSLDKDYRIKIADAAYPQLSAISAEPFTLVSNAVPQIRVSDDDFCEGDTITLDAGEGFEKYLWSTGETSREIRVTASGKYRVTVTSAADCSQEAVKEVYFQWSPEAPLIETDGPVTRCEGDSIVLKGPEGYSGYRWSTGDTTQSVTLSSPGGYQVSVHNELGCFSPYSAPTELNFLPRPAPPVIEVGGETSICDGDSLLMTTVSPFKEYRWSNGLKSRSIMVKDGGKYAVTVLDSLGCYSASSDSITVHLGYPPSRPELFTSETVFCEGEEVTVSGPQGYHRYLWSNGASGEEALVTESTALSLRVMDSIGCLSQSSDTLTMTFNKAPEVPTIFFQDSTTFCAGESIVLHAPSGHERYFWSNGARSDSITITASGSYTLRVGDSLSCYSYPSVPVEVTVIPKVEKPLITSGGAIAICSGAPIELGAPAGFDRYLWSTGDTTATITVDTVGMYWVEVANDKDNCNPPVRSDELAVVAEDSPGRPEIRLQGPSSINAGDSVVLEAPEGYAAYLWSDGTLSRTVTVDTTGTFTVQVFTTGGCASPSSMPVSIMLKPDAVTGLDEELLHDTFGLVARPNPFTDQAHAYFRVPVSGRVKIDLYDMLGHFKAPLFYGSALAGLEYKLELRNIGHLSKNVYVLRLTTSDGMTYHVRLLKR